MNNNSCWAETVARLHAAEKAWLEGIDPELPKKLEADRLADYYTEDELR